MFQGVQGCCQAGFAGHAGEPGPDIRSELRDAMYTRVS